ncbi:NADP-dependent oxidoreductase [Bacillus pumilus]|uniref:NADP-dependent oxidoreductase n=1 Tax=Bacillus pumilus TaxID=1408 RepID=UPI002281D305|nr:NADP-dependent oxidoreductase [Bacillus pumilus]MCY7500743.1 NADP-dependent oxidoreductase [Bacillus pumilus]MCY7526471.1 NADP-dependent oxidoreductase [Bacillus pumilus]MED4438994.1 NADP-dependent oxidoreductase [Bacillus pumilus]MED4491387.1 NADP-dependent oxidoreductase [Bacillus pumilus]
MKTLMKAAQITKYSKNIHAKVNDIPIPEIDENEVLVKVKAAAVNPLEMLIITGSVKLIQDYEFPLTLGNELTGVIEKIGKNVTEFHVGDAIYTRLPLKKIGAFAEYAAIDAAAIAPMPKNLSYVEAAAVPLAGLTAYQGLHEELEAQSGKSVFIPGGSGSFGQMAVPIAKEMGADQYLDYAIENYVDLLSNVDYVIDTLGPKEFDSELSIIKPGGRLLSLRTGPNKRFGKYLNSSLWKRILFSLAGANYDRKAKKQNVEYHFIFVRSDGAQLKEITKIIEENNIVPAIHPILFTIDNVNEALELVANGRPKGKVIINF